MKDVSQNETICSVGNGGHGVVGRLYTSAAGAPSTADAGRNAGAGEDHPNLDTVCAARAFKDAPRGDGNPDGYGGFDDFASSNGHAGAFVDACAACGYAVPHRGGEFSYACAAAHCNAQAAYGHGISCPDAAAPYGDALPNAHRGAANGHRRAAYRYAGSYSHRRAACRHPIANGHGCASYDNADTYGYPSAAHGYPFAAHGDADAANAYAGGV